MTLMPYSQFAAAAATIASPLPSPALSLNDCPNPWANIIAHPVTSSASTAAKGLATPAVVYSNSPQPAISYDRSTQPKNVINDVLLSSTMLFDDDDGLCLSESPSASSSPSICFDSDSDSGLSTPLRTDDEDPTCFATPMTPMSPFMESDADERLYSSDETDLPLAQPEEPLEDSVHSINDSTKMVVDMKRPMFIPVSICDTRDFAAMASLPTPPECNARKHSYDFQRNSDAFFPGGDFAKRRRMLSVDMMSVSGSDVPASPPASNAGDDEAAELSDCDYLTCSPMRKRTALFRHVRHLTPTSPSTPDIVCFAPPTHEEYDYHPELDHSDDEEEEEQTRAGDLKETIATAAPSDLFVVEAVDQESALHPYLSEDNYSSSDDEVEFGHVSEHEMQIDAMSSSDESDSDLSDTEEDQCLVSRRGTWHGPSLEEIERTGRHKKRLVPIPESQPSSVTVQPVRSAPVLQSLSIHAPVSVPEMVISKELPVETSSSAVDSSVDEGKGSRSLTLFQILTKANIDWCRYCGTTEGVNWRPGPWGKRTLCNKHGCDFKGYGFACKLPRLDLTSYTHETVDQRIRPVLQHFCHGCQSQESAPGNVMVRCEGCPKAFHQRCHTERPISDEIALSDKAWFCDDNCRENVKKRRVCVELPKKRLPLMSTPKPAASSLAAGGMTAAGTAASEAAMMTATATTGSPRPRGRATLSV